MSSAKVGIVEDEIIIARGIALALEELGYTATEPAGNFNEAVKMLQEEKPDIVLLDINLGGKKDGIDLAWKIREEYNIPFIFLTANADAATVERAKKVNPPAYLVKPFNKEKLFSSIEICLFNFLSGAQKENMPEEGNYMIKDSLFIKQGQYFNKVRLDDIVYLESDNVYIHVHTVDKKILVRSSLQNYLDLINSKRFFRIHRSYAINIAHIETINSEFVVVGQKQLPLAKAYRDDLLSHLRLG